MAACPLPMGEHSSTKARDSAIDEDLGGSQEDTQSGSVVATGWGSAERGGASGGRVGNYLVSGLELGQGTERGHI